MKIRLHSPIYGFALPLKMQKMDFTRDFTYMELFSSHLEAFLHSRMRFLSKNTPLPPTPSDQVRGQRRPHFEKSGLEHEKSWNTSSKLARKTIRAQIWALRGVARRLSKTIDEISENPFRRGVRTDFLQHCMQDFSKTKKFFFCVFAWNKLICGPVTFAV